MKLSIDHGKYTHVDIKGYRERKNGETRYDVVIVPVTVDGMFVRTEAYAGYRVNLTVCNRASRSAECRARDIAGVLVPEALAALGERYGFEAPDFDSDSLTFAAC